MEKVVVSVIFLIFINFVYCKQIKSSPNILFILADDLGWNDVGFTGNSDLQTPNIDSLAYNGRILTKYYTLPTCTPSRVAFLTGRNPIRTGMHGIPLSPGEPRALALDSVLLPQHLKKLGYQTHLVGKWHVGCHEWKYTPTKRGFDSHFGYFNGFIGYYNHHMELLNKSGHDFWRNDKAKYELQGQYVTDLLTEESIRLIKKSSKNKKPLFLYLSHLAPHAGNPGDNDLEYHEEDLQRFSYISNERRRKYAAMVWSLDQSVGKIVNSLSENNLLNNTIIIFTSDNGAQTIGKFENEGSNYPLRGLKFTMLEGAIHTPTLIWTPQIHSEPKGDATQLMHITDWLPTLYVAAGGDEKDLSGLDGRNQWDILNQEQKPDNTYAIHKEILINIDEQLNMQGLRYKQWKIVTGAFYGGMYDDYHGNFTNSNYTYNPNDVTESMVGKVLKDINRKYDEINNENILDKRSRVTINCDIIENNPNLPDYSYIEECNSSVKPCLFDIDNDPCERINLAEIHPDIVEKLLTKLETYMQQLKPQLNLEMDETANPIFYNNTWIPWKEPSFVAYFTNNANIRTFMGLSSSILLYANTFVLIISLIFATLI